MRRMEPGEIWAREELEAVYLEEDIEILVIEAE